MKIKIEHISNTYNYGSCMMAITLMKKIKDNIDNVEFWVDASSFEDLDRLKKESGIENVKSYNLSIKSNIVFRAINKIKKVVLTKLSENCDVVIVIGGDDISEYYGKEYLENILKKIKTVSEEKKVILLGQTMGPFTGERKELAKESLKNTRIYTRDDICLSYLESLGFKNVNIGRDLAFLELPMQRQASSILNKYNIKNSKYITIVPSGLTECYTKNLESYIKEQVNIVKKTLDNKKLEDFKIVLLPHVLLPEHVDDRLIIKEIMNRIDKDYKNRIVAIMDSMLPSEAREILGNGLFTITGRMHAAVSTFYMRKPAISLSYSVKYSGVIGDGLDMNDLVIESADKDLWENGEISKLVEEKVNYVLDNYDELIKKIDIKVNETSKITENQLNDLINELQKIKK